ncbi:MAG TPA: hypothetical protein VFV75_02425 [Candidatus Polarisedimenticolaceae bacterium]|nr:hypothetical protein [Candidatus Polarisedimenticolaceae bacterium]
MRLEAIAAEIRPRRPAEAMDLGMAMVRTWWKDVYGAWLAAAVPTAILAAAVFRHQPILALLAFWLLKPLLDHAPLFALGRALFGERTGAGAALRALPGIWRRCGLLALTAHRLDPGRAFTLPVSQLERLRGAARRARVRTLSRRGHADTVLLKGFCSCFELVLVLGLLAFAVLMLPSPEAELTWIEWSVSTWPPPVWLLWVLVGAEMLAVLFMEPLYVAGGFALYLARRTQVEAWDVEMGFRRLARREEVRRGRGALPAAVVALALLLGAAPPPEPEDAVKKVLEDPAFSTTRKVTAWTFGERKEVGPRAGGAPGLAALGSLLGALLEPLLWAAVLALLGWLLWRAVRLDRARTAALPATGPPVQSALFGLDLRPDSLPADLPGEARRLLAEGKAAEALSLLYRGALAALVARKVTLPRSATEGDCLRAARAAIGAEPAAFFASLTSAWQACAYAQRAPADPVLEGLVRDWPRHFGAAR